MDKSKEFVHLDLDMLDKVAGGTGEIEYTGPEYVYYSKTPDRHSAILQGACPDCKLLSVIQIGSACYGCTNCHAGFVLIGGPST